MTDIDPDGVELVQIRYTDDGRKRRVDPPSAISLIERGKAELVEPSVPEAKESPEPAPAESPEPAPAESTEALPADPDPGPSIVIEGRPS